MTPKALKAEVIRLGGTVDKPENYNTNNQWGFGGMIGTRTKFTLDGVTCWLDDGQLCYRHLAPERECHVHVQDVRNKPFTPELFMRLFSQGARSFEEFKTLWQSKGSPLSSKLEAKEESNVQTKRNSPRSRQPRNRAGRRSGVSR